MMTTEDKINAFIMMLDGATYQEISDELHFTKQQNAELAEICVYPCIAEYIRNRQFVEVQLYRAVLKARLTGKIPFSSAEWLKLAELTGVRLERMNGKWALGTHTRNSREPQE